MNGAPGWKTNDPYRGGGQQSGGWDGGQQNNQQNSQQNNWGGPPQQGGGTRQGRMKRRKDIEGDHRRIRFTLLGFMAMMLGLALVWFVIYGIFFLVLYVRTVGGISAAAEAFFG